MRARVFVALAASACLAHAADDSSEKAAALVRQLGDDSFEARERAARRLLAMGHAAADAVREGQSDADAEVSSRCKALLPRIVKVHLDARIKAFLTNEKASLPGWEVYYRSTGKPRDARRSFADLFRRHAEFLELLDRDIGRANAEFAKRCR